ncbi:hypothetical protein TNCV_264471 [Trichonephila clavipes]|nr:hypothetical protein TNCV_264471 [Trichonephila clavipes]
MIDFEQFKCPLLVDQRPTYGFSSNKIGCSLASKKHRIKTKTVACQSPERDQPHVSPLYLKERLFHQDAAADMGKQIVIQRYHIWAVWWLTHQISLQCVECPASHRTSMWLGVILMKDNHLASEPFLSIFANGIAIFD